MKVIWINEHFLQRKINYQEDCFWKWVSYNGKNVLTMESVHNSVHGNLNKLVRLFDMFEIFDEQQHSYIEFNKIIYFIWRLQRLTYLNTYSWPDSILWHSIKEQKSHKSEIRCWTSKLQSGKVLCNKVAMTLRKNRI